MRRAPEKERRWAVARAQAGELITAVAAALRRSRRWVYTWLARARTGDPHWATDRSHRPAELAHVTSPAVVEAVRLVRLHLYNRGLLAGSYHLVRFIRSDRRPDIFGERFLLPPEAEYKYGVATVQVEPQRLRVMLGADLVAEFPYKLR